MKQSLSVASQTFSRGLFHKYILCEIINLCNNYFLNFLWLFPQKKKKKLWKNLIFSFTWLFPQISLWKNVIYFPVIFPHISLTFPCHFPWPKPWEIFSIISHNFICKKSHKKSFPIILNMGKVMGNDFPQPISCAKS